jgi:hypothetical protein
MDLVLLDHQHVFSHKLSLGGEMAKKRGFKKYLKIVSEALFTIYILLIQLKTAECIIICYPVIYLLFLNVGIFVQLCVVSPRFTLNSVQVNCGFEII